MDEKVLEQWAVKNGRQFPWFAIWICFLPQGKKQINVDGLISYEMDEKVLEQWICFLPKALVFKQGWQRVSRRSHHVEVGNTCRGQLQ